MKSGLRTRGHSTISQRICPHLFLLFRVRVFHRPALVLISRRVTVDRGSRSRERDAERLQDEVEQYGEQDGLPWNNRCNPRGRFVV